MLVIDPGQRDLLFVVGGGSQRNQRQLTAVLSVVHMAMEGDHVTGGAFNRFLDRSLTGGVRFGNIGFRGDVRCAALQKAQLNAADLGAGLRLDEIGQHGSQTAQLRMTEAVGRRGFCLGNETAVRIMDTFGNRNQNLSVCTVDALDIGEELIHIEVRLRQVDQVRAGAEISCEAGACRQPAGMASHDLNDRDHAVVVHAGILADLHAGRRNILCRAAEAGAVVRTEKVVVDRLGHAHDAAFITDGFHVAADFVAGVHGIVTAVIEEITDVILFEDLEDTAVVRIVDFRILHLVTAGAKLGRGSMQQQLKLFRIFFVHYVKLIVQNAADAVRSTVNLRNFLCIQGRTDHAVSAGVDNSRRTARLAKDAGADEFLIH